MTKCNVCSRADNLMPHPFIPGAMICPDHAPKSASKKKLEVEQRFDECYRIDKAELKALRMDGLLSIKTYVYMALMIDYPSGSKSIDLKSFCAKWGVPAHELLQAIGQLSKKGLVNIKAQVIDADVLTREQREGAIKEAVNGK